MGTTARVVRTAESMLSCQEAVQSSSMTDSRPPPAIPTKQIGAQLYISPRTVGAHLYRIFPKLGITSRAGLAVALAQLGER